MTVWPILVLGITTVWFNLNATAMKKQMILFLLCLVSVNMTYAQFAKPLKNRNFICRNTSSFSVGVTGSYAANDMLYSEVSKAILSPYLAPTFGAAMEWNTMRGVSVGLDASYAMRGANEVFATEFLTSYANSTFARVNYAMTMNGVEVRLPIACYFGYGENTRPYVFIAPRFDLWLNGNLRWERTYDDESYAPLVYESELNQATMRPYDVSIMAGVGLCHRFMVSRTQFFMKLDVSYGTSVLNNLSQLEVDESIPFQGWGDIEHETLGQRYLQNVEARLSCLIPLRKPLKDACAFEQKTKRPK